MIGRRQIGSYWLKELYVPLMNRLSFTVRVVIMKQLDIAVFFSIKQSRLTR